MIYARAVGASAESEVERSEPVFSRVMATGVLLVNVFLAMTPPAVAVLALIGLLR